MNESEFLAGLSASLTARVAAARSSIAAIRLSDEHHLTGILWRADVVVTSEQSLPRRDEFTVVLEDSKRVGARVAGRDPGTNIAVLRIAEHPSATPWSPATAQPGSIVLALGADGAGDATARLGVVNRVAPEWHSVAGGRIDQRVVLDIRLGRSEEGGPVIDAAGAYLGMSTFGPRRRVLVIPAATLERVVPALLQDGRIARGWLGIALQPVAVPEPLQQAAGQSSGLMVMSIADGGPAAKAGVVAGDIVVALDGTPVRRARGVAARLGADSVGRSADLQVIRAGGVVSLQVTIEARPAG